MSEKRLSRRSFLQFSAVTALGAALAACAQPTAAPTVAPTTAPAQPTTAPAQPTTAPAQPTPTPAGPQYKEAPMLAEQVKAGKLPPVEQRLPAEPRVIEPIERIGKYGGDMRLGTTGMADGAWFTRNITYENLVHWNVEWTDVIPNVCKSWEVEDGGKTFIFNLRKGMKWSDGEPFTADDVTFWYEEASNKELNPTFSKTWSTAGDPVVVTKIDDYTVKFAYTKPYGLFLQRLACPGGNLYSPRHYRKKFFPAYADKDFLATKVKEAGVSNWFEAYGNWMDHRVFPEQPVIWGWVYTSKLADVTTFICPRNPYYWKVDPEGNQLPYIDRQVYAVAGDTQSIVMMAMAGEISFQDRHIASAANKPVFLENAQKADIRFVNTVGSSMNSCTIALNLTDNDPVLRELFQMKDFRIALSHAINRQEIIDIVHLGLNEPWQWAPRPGTPFYDEEMAKQYTEYDPAKANEILDKILPKRDSEGYRLRQDGQPLGIVIETSGARDDIEMVTEYWNAVGIRTTNKPMDRALFYTRKDANEHSCAVWGGDGGVDVILEPRWYFPYSTESLYAERWVQWYQSNGQAGEEPPAPTKKQMELYDELLVTPDTQKQIELMKEILKIAKEQFYGIGISLPAPGYAVVKNKFRNVPEEYWSSWLYPNPGPMNPCQFFWDV